MSGFESLSAWLTAGALALLLAGAGLIIGWLTGLSRGERNARQLQAMDEQALRAKAGQEQALYQQQLEQLRDAHHSAQLQIRELREALEQERTVRAQWQERSQRIAPLEAGLEQQQQATRAAQDALSRLQAEHAALSALHDEQALQAVERSQFLNRASESLQAQFQHLADTILEEKSSRFLQQNQQGLGQLLDPLRQRLTEFQQRVEHCYDSEGKQRAMLAQQVHDLAGMNQRLSDEAAQLARALQGSSKTQGNWGEMLLLRLLEQAGLREGGDFCVQPSFVRADGSRAQPDVIVNLPGDRHVVVDAKVSLTAYTRLTALDNDAAAPATAAQGPDNAARRDALRQHLGSVRTHVRQLAQRQYHQLAGLQSPDFVILFVPIEPAFLLALAEDEQLMNEAWKRNVLLASPSTLLFALRTIALLWRQEAQNRNAQEIAGKGAELYDQLAEFASEMEKLGQQLNTAQRSYEQAMHRLAGQKGNVIRRAEQLRQLGLQPAKRIAQTTLQRGDVQEFRTPVEEPVEESAESTGDSSTPTR